MSDIDTILNEAGAAFEAGRFGAAAAGFEHAVTSHPDIPELHINLGAARRAAGDLHGAESAYRQALILAPGNALAWFNLGNLLRDADRPSDALAAYRNADALQPDTPEFLINLGVQLYDAGEIETALEKYDAALRHRPAFADAHTNRGNALQRLCRMPEAEAALKRALELSPNSPVCRLNMAAFMAAAGRHDQAIAWCDKALLADPAYTEAKLKRASLLIQQQKLEAGFAAYEARWGKRDWHPLPASLPMPPWQGEDIAGKTLLIWNEQGFGDALLYARYLPLLASQGANVIFMCEGPLIRLMRQSLGDGVVVRDLAAQPPEADLHASIMSLPYLCGTRMDTIPATGPYLYADATEAHVWRRELSDVYGAKPVVGLVWAGNPNQAHDYARSIPPDAVRSLLSNRNVGFVNLLVGPRGGELRHENLLDLRHRLTDFAASAASMRALDLVITVDSAPAHLAGALGVPVWIALSFDPDSRYFLGRTDSPWYPTARLFRQESPGDWTEPLARIGAELARNGAGPAKG